MKKPGFFRSVRIIAHNMEALKHPKTRGLWKDILVKVDGVMDRWLTKK
jgi:hypothetical protein